MTQPADTTPPAPPPATTPAFSNVDADLVTAKAKFITYSGFRATAQASAAAATAATAQATADQAAADAAHADLAAALGLTEADLAAALS